MSPTWPLTTLNDAAQTLQVLTELRGKRWICRGQAKDHNSIMPSIDRDARKNLTRSENLAFERRSIDLFRSTAHFFADDGERVALTHDVGALMVLRHYGAPTRLLDWSLSPFVAAFFAVEELDDESGELWGFDHDQYVTEGTKQWTKWRQTTNGRTGKGEHFDPALTMFAVREPPPWFVCNFYQIGFPRQNAQSGAYSMTARFGVDHAHAIANLLAERRYYHRYLIPGSLKVELRTLLREIHGIWQGSLYPDTAGAAETVKRALHVDPKSSP